MKILNRILFLIILFSNNLKSSTVEITALTPPSNSGLLKPCPGGARCMTNAMCIDCQIPGRVAPGLGLFPLKVAGKASGVKAVSVTLHNNFDDSDQVQSTVVRSNGLWGPVSFPFPDDKAIPTSRQSDGSALIITAEASGAIQSKAFLTVLPARAGCDQCGPGVICIIPQDILTIAILKKYHR